MSLRCIGAGIGTSAVTGYTIGRRQFLQAALAATALPLGLSACAGRKQGPLLVGHSENLHNVTDRFELVARTIYRRVK